MAFEYMNALFEAGDDLDQTPFWVLMSICWHARDDQRQGRASCWPSLKRIAIKAHVSDNVARRAIKTLFEKKVIEAEQQPGGKRTFFVYLGRIKALSQRSISHGEPLADVEGVADVEPLADVEGDPLQIRNHPPCTCERGPLADVQAEPVREPVREPVKEQGREQVVGAFENAPPPTDSDLEAMASSGSLFAEADVPAEEPPKKKKKKKPRPLTVPFPDSLPDEWRERALKLRPNIDPEEVFTALRSRYGETTVRKAMSTWQREYFNWHGRQWPKKTFNRNQTQGRAYVPGDRKFSYATLDTSQFDYEG